MTIKIPQSVQLYYENNAVQTAINSLIDTKIKVSNQSLKELEGLYKAKLSTEKTKLDYWLFLNEIYQNVVVKTVEELKPAYKELADEWEDDNTEESTLDIKSVWDNGHFGTIFSSGNNFISLTIDGYNGDDCLIKFSHGTFNEKANDGFEYEKLKATEKYKYFIANGEEDDETLCSQIIKITGEELDVSELKSAVMDFLKGI